MIMLYKTSNGLFTFTSLHPYHTLANKLVYLTVHLLDPAVMTIFLFDWFASIPTDLWPDLCLEPPSWVPARPKQVDTYNAKFRSSEIFVYGSWNVKNKDFNWGPGCVKTSAGGIVSCVRQQAGHGEKWRDGESGGAQEATLSSKSPTVTIFISASQGKWLQWPLKSWTEHAPPGPDGQKITLRSTILIIWAYSHDPPFQTGRISQSSIEEVCYCPWALHLGLENSLLSGWSLWSWEHCGCSFLGWSRSCPGKPCPGLGLQRFNLQVLLLLQRPWELGSPEILKSKEHPVRADLWLLVIIFSLSLWLSTLPSSVKSISSLPCMGLIAFLLSLPVGSKHRESKYSLYP